MGYHRLLTHRGYKTPKWVEYFLTLCGTLALEGGPIFWVATHRIHHQHSDHEGDPHSPREGTYWAHMGWIFTGKAMHHDTAVLRRYVPDLSQDQFTSASPRGTGCRRWSSASACSRSAASRRAVGHLLPYDLRPARDLAGELGDAPLGFAPLRDARRLDQQLVGGDAHASARAGTTTITPTRSRRAMASPGTRSTSTTSASRRWRSWAWPGTSRSPKLRRAEEEAA